MSDKRYETKASNPKDAIGSNKIPMHLWPETATVLGSLGLLDGALKYGRSNFREIGVRASIYYDAAKRHLNAWFEGEECDPDSKLPHLAHALACLAIIVDAEAAGKLNDDRMVKGGYREMIDQLTPHVARLKEQHADKAPKHYTIADSLATPHLTSDEMGALLAGPVGAPIRRMPKQQFGTIMGGDFPAVVVQQQLAWNEGWVCGKCGTTELWTDETPRSVREDKYVLCADPDCNGFMVRA